MIFANDNPINDDELDLPKVNEPTPNYDSLIDRHKLFVDYYVGACNLNASAAAKKVGYSSYNNAGNQLKNNPVIARAITEKLTLKMSKEEVLARLSMLAAFDPNDVYTVNPDGTLTLDVEKLKQPNVLYALRKYTRTLQGNITRVNVEFEDRTKVLELLGKHYKLFSDVVTMGIRGESTAPELTDDELMQIALTAITQPKAE